MVAKLGSKRVNGKASYQPIQEELNDNPYSKGTKSIGTKWLYVK